VAFCLNQQSQRVLDDRLIRFCFGGSHRLSNQTLVDFDL
jgi:hypothetical protein